MQIEAQVKNDPRDFRHQVNLVQFDGTTKTFEKCIVIVCDYPNKILEFLDENDVHQIVYIPNYARIFFDKTHRKLIEQMNNQQAKNG